MKRIFVILGLLFLSGVVQALTLIPITDAMRIEQAERIVIGRLEGDGAETVIVVEDVLKGAAEPRVIRPTRKPMGAVAPKVLWVEGAPGSRISHFRYIQEGSPVWTLYQMLRDPGPVLDLAGGSGSVGAIQVLAYLFDPVAVSSEDAPEVAGRLETIFAKDHFPWDFQGTIDFRCRADPERRSRLEILSMDPDTRLSRGFRWAVIGNGMQESMREALSEPFSLRIDTRPAEVRGSLDLAGATDYLHGCLDSSDRDVQVAAVRALARIRDLDAVSAVIRLIDTREEELVRVVMRFLGRSRDSRAVEPLCRLLEANAPFYPKNHWLSDGAAQALGRIGDVRATPFLESAAAHGVERAFEALRPCGRAESIGVILDAVGGEGLTNGAGVSLFWLVSRSNKPVEPWMNFAEMQGQPMRPTVIGKWKQWWAGNQSDLKLERSFEDALIAWHPPVHEVPSAGGHRHFQVHWWKYLVGLVLLGAAFFVGWKRSKTG